ILYIIDCVYDKIHHQNTFIQSHLEWLSYNYIMYLGLFLLNHWLIEPLLDLINIHFNIVFLFITLLILIRYVSGFNLALSAKNAPHHNLVPYLSRYIFNYFKKILANKP
ncbi:MAG: hypothetical protein RLZZ293_760, partial [Pseudomonadota bacterium]